MKGRAEEPGGVGGDEGGQEEPGDGEGDGGAHGGVGGGRAQEDGLLLARRPVDISVGVDNFCSSSFSHLYLS